MLNVTFSLLSKCCYAVIVLNESMLKVVMLSVATQSVVILNVILNPKIEGLNPAGKGSGGKSKVAIFSRQN